MIVAAIWHTRPITGQWERVGGGEGEEEGEGSRVEFLSNVSSFADEITLGSLRKDDGNGSENVT